MQTWNVQARQVSLREVSWYLVSLYVPKHYGAVHISFLIENICEAHLFDTICACRYEVLIWKSCELVPDDEGQTSYLMNVLPVVVYN